MRYSKTYPKEVVEYIQVRLETTTNNSALAREVIRKFNIKSTPQAVRMKINDIQTEGRIRGKMRKQKRLFFDIETSFITFRGWRTGKQWVSHDNIITDKKIICISYKWQYENEVHTLKWDSKQSDRSMIKKFIKILGEADEIVGHNGDRFDIKEIRTRAIQEGVLMFPTYRTLDTLKKARKYFNFHSNKLDYLGQVLKVGRKLDHEGMELWVKVVNGNKTALDKMIKYCEQDVILLEDVFNALSPFIDHNTNFAVLSGGEKWHCPECASENVSLCHTDTTPVGYIKRHMKCHKCRKQYRVANKTYMRMLEDLMNIRYKRILWKQRN
jgi:uncharacterized protein YprB with RNaseH-like and TPR domain